MKKVKTGRIILYFSDAGYGLGSDFQDDNFARRKQRRNRTTFTLQQVNKIKLLNILKIFDIVNVHCIIV